MDEVAKKISNAMSIKNKPSPKVTSKDPLVWTTEINDDTYEDILEELCEINDNGLVTYKQNANFMKAMKKSQGYEIDVTDALKGVEDEYDLKLIRDLMYKVGIRQK